MLNSLSEKQTLWLLFAITAATIIGAWIFQFAGYPPCELCLMQRYAYYCAVPISFAFALFAGQRQSALRIGLIIIGLIMLGSMVFGIFHSGVEWKFWAGPTTCTGNGGLSGGLPDLSKPAVMCDKPAIRILGLSLAGWNAVISACCAGLALRKA